MTESELEPNDVVGILIVMGSFILYALLMFNCIITLITSASTMVITLGTMMMEMMMEWLNGWMLSFINERTIGIAAFIIIGTMHFLQQRNNHAALSADIRQLSNAIAENNYAALRHREQQPHPAAHGR